MAPPTFKMRIQCSTLRCKGSCPLDVVQKASMSGGVPAKCWACNSVYKMPPGIAAQVGVAADAPEGGDGRGKVRRRKARSKEEGEKAKSAAAVAAQRIADLESKLAAAIGASEDAAPATESGEEPAKDQIKALRERLKTFHLLDDSLQYLSQSSGGHA